MVAVPSKVPNRDHAGLLPGLDGNVGGDVPFHQQFPQRTLAAAGGGGQGLRLLLQAASNWGTALGSRSEALMTARDRMNPPKSTMAFS